METIATALIFFILGSIFGFFLRTYLSKLPFNFNADSRINWLIIVVSLVWVVSVSYDIANPSYSTSPFIHSIMGAVVGFFFYRPKN